MNELLIRINANATNFNDALKEVEKKTKALNDNLDKINRASAIAFGVLTAAIGGSVAAAARFEATFTNIVTQLDKTSFSTKTLDQGIADLRKGVIQLGVDSGENFAVLNTGLFELVSAGIPAEEALKQLGAASNLAIAGATDTASAVKALISAYTSYGAAAGTAQEVAEKFFTASKYGVTDVQGIATEFNKVAGLAFTLGVSFDEALGSATALTNNGAKPVAQAFTQFEAVLNSVILAQDKLKTESPEVQKALSLSNVRTVGLNEALRQTVTAVGGSVPALQKLLGSSNALAAVLSLTGAQAETAGKLIEALSDKEKQAADFAAALAVKKETLEKATARAARALEAAAIVLGTQFLPIVNAVADAVSATTKTFSEMSPAMQKLTAIAVGFFFVLAGGIVTLGLAGKALLSYSTYMGALEVAFGAGRIAATKFWAATTLGVSLVIASLPLVYDQFKKLIDLLQGGEKPKTLEEINKELERMKQLRADVDSGKDINFGDKKGAQLEKIDAEIAKLEDLKQKQIEVNKAKAGKTEAGTAPAAPDNTEATKTAYADAETRKRINLAQKEREQLRLIGENASKEEIEFAKRREDLRIAGVEAQSMTNAQERALAIENMRLKNEQLLLEEDEYQTKRAEALRVAREQQAVVDQELELLSSEQRAAIRQADIDAVTAQVKTEDQIRSEGARAKLQRQVDAANTYNANVLKYGKASAEIQRVLNSEEVQGAANAANQLISLQQSKNNTLKTIGKAAALTRIAIDTATGALSAYNSLSIIPIVGPALGAAAAAALIAFGAEQTSNVLAANTGGRVPLAGGIVGRDSVPAMLTPGEFVVPAQSYDEVVDAVAAQRSGDGGGSGANGDTFIIQGDFYGEETFIDRLADNLKKAKRTRNVEY